MRNTKNLLSFQECMFNSNSLKSLITDTQMPTAGLKFNVQWQVFKSHRPWDGLVFSQFAPNRFWSFQQNLALLCHCTARCMGLPQCQQFPPNVLGYQCHQDNLTLWMIPWRSPFGAASLVLNGPCDASKKSHLLSLLYTTSQSSSPSMTTPFFHSFCPWMNMVWFSQCLESLS